MGDLQIREKFLDKYDVTHKTEIVVVDHVTSLGNWDEEPVLIFKTREGEIRTNPWLTRGQVQDLMVVLGYWLKQTEGEDDGT